MVPFTHLVLQFLQSFSKVFRVLFSVGTEAFETAATITLLPTSRMSLKL